MKRKVYYFLAAFIIILVISAFRQHKDTSDATEISTEIEMKPAPKPKRIPTEIDGILQEYDSLLTTEIKETGTVGAAVAITYKNQIAYLKCFGVKKVGTHDSINENTIFRLASVSKTVSGVLAGILDEDNIIDLDDKVVKYLPGFKLKNTKSTKEMTIRNLLSHTSGLVPHAYDLMVEDKVPMGKIINKLDEVNIAAPPGQVYGYQNVMFSLLDTITAKKTSQSYPELLKEKLFMPFGMNDASADFQSFKNSDNIAFPHSGAHRHYRALRLNDRYYNTAPAAGVNASISDMAHFLLALLNKENSVVDNEIRETVFTPQVDSHLSRRYLTRWDKVDSKQYAIGWRIIGYKGRKVAYHGGYVQGYRAEIALCEKEDVGIVFLCNSPNSISAKSIPDFLNLFFEFKDKNGILTDAQTSKSPANDS
jgi:beta-lactamase class C